AFHRGCALAGPFRLVEKDFEEIGRADIARGLEMPNRIELQVGMANAARDDGATQRVEAGLKNERTWRKMVGERVVDDIAGSETAGEQRAGGAIAIKGFTFGLEDRAG